MRMRCIPSMDHLVVCGQCLLLKLSFSSIVDYHTVSTGKYVPTFRMNCGCQLCLVLFCQWTHRGISKDLIRYAEKTLLKVELRGGFGGWVLGLALSQYISHCCTEN